jgi:hypothetical protein
MCIVDYTYVPGASATGDIRILVTAVFLRCGRATGRLNSGEEINSADTRQRIVLEFFDDPLATNVCPKYDAHRPLAQLPDDRRIATAG